MRHGTIWLGLLIVALTGWTVLSAQPPKPNPVPAESPGDEPNADEEKEKAIANRFRTVLETNPRRGTALDRLYGYHVERGTLDKLIGEYTERTKKDPQDGIAWAIVGMLESQRGRDAAAVAAFGQAETALPNNAIPSYYLGQSLVLVGRPDTAAEAFERALTRKPNRNDLLEIFQALGRVYQRAQQTEKALNVWDRLEKLYPDDARVQEQIATTLIEEGQFDQALPRLTKLADQTEDKYRQSALRIDVADLKVRLKKSTEALADFEKLLSELNPDSWLYRDVRRRVEEVFLRNDDLAGLAKYYEKWLEKNSTDVDAISRLSKSLASQGRAADARAWLEKGIAVAPNNRGLRQALVDQYVAEQNFAAAVQQYEAMDKADPNNPDTLREWGKLIMRDPAKPEADRRVAAAAVWQRILAKKPTDPVTTSQVADLLRTAGATDDAVALYKKAIDLAPGQPQYREYLGEYFHTLKRSADAIATWRPIAEGANHTSKNLARLAEVFAGFGYRKEAIGALADAIGLEKDDFTLLMTYADQLHQDGQNDESLKQIDAAGKLTSNPEEVEQVLVAQIKVFQATDTLGAKIDELDKDLKAGKDATVDRWLRLARYFEANRQADQATEAIRNAVAKDPKSVPATIASARIYEAGGDLLAAAEANRKLSILDRRFRTEYLTAVAKLEQRLGRRTEAMQAGRDLLAASPGNPDVYKFFADLCFQLGDQEEGLEALRRSVRANPSDPAGLITLANALGERIRQGEAIELLWRAFEKTNDLEGKIGVIERITQLYLENNQFDRLLERLERERRDSDKSREMTMCLAQAYTTAGDLGTARQQLERLLTENTRDAHLLVQLVALCENEGDIAAALKYQRALVAAAPSNYDHQLKLAQVLTRSGETDEAADLWVKLVAGETEPHRNLSAIDNLLTAGKTDSALAILTRFLVQKPGNWELLYREGAGLAAKGKKDEAAARFRAVLALKMSDDELGEVARNALKQAKKKATAAPRPGQAAAPNLAARFDDSKMAPLTRRTQYTHQIRAAVGMDNQNYYGGPQPFYAPTDFGEARMACHGWLYEFARAKDAANDYVSQLKTARDKAGVDFRPLWDWYYFQTLRNERGKDVLPTTFTLSNGADPAGLLAYVNAVSSRTSNNVVRSSRRLSDPKDNTPPLPPDQLSHLLACYRKLKQLRPEWVTSGYVTPVVMTELKRAKKAEEETAIYKEWLAAATTPDTIRAALGLAAERNDLDAAVTLFTRLDKLQGPAKNTAQLAQLPTRTSVDVMETLMGKRAEEKKYADVLKIADLYLATARRQNLAAPKTSSTSRRISRSQTSLYFGAVKGLPPNVTLTFPNPNEYFDIHCLSALYCTHLLFKNADLTSDLLAHLRKQSDAAQGGEKLYLQLALGYVYWWIDDKDEAINRLTEAVRSAPSDHNLLIEVAALREQIGEHDAALALLDSVTPVDTQMMQRREEAALRLAERTGNLDRARQAADRLFGLRLDADKQLELASKMHRLGLPKLAEAVLGRAQRQAGNKTSTLVSLMYQYQNQNQSDLAVQIARQILRRVPAASPNPNRGVTVEDNARNQAVSVLSRSGQIKELIERAEAQVKASPKSVPLLQALGSYYLAAGEKDKHKGTLLKTIELKPDDGKLRLQLAQQLQQLGDQDAAIQNYAAAIKLEPSLLGNSYYEIQRLFSQANKFEELAKLFDEIDMRKIGHYYYAVNPIATLLQNDKTRDIGLKLFKKAWEAFPQERAYLMSQLYDESIWRLPEIYNYAKTAALPREDSDVDPWQVASQIMSYGGDGRVDGVLTRLLSIARKQQRLPELRAEIESALAKRPDWTGGKALLGVIDIQSGNKERGKKLWKEAFADSKSDVPPTARFILVQELEFYAGMEDLAVSTLEAGIEDLIKDGNYEFSYGPGRRLIWWYEQMGRKDDARKTMMRFVNTEMVDPGYSGGYWQYRQISNKVAIAQEFQRTGDVIEAVRLYNQLLADQDAMSQASQYGGERYEQMAEAGLKSALKSVKPDTLPAAVGSLLTPRTDAGPGKPALDLVLLIESRDIDKAVLNSVFASAIKSTEKSPQIRDDALAKLSGLADKLPNDFTVQTALALATFADGKPERTKAALDRLIKLVDATPLDALPPNGKANSRQRAEALTQLPIWLVARECLAKDRDPFREAGIKLATRAVDAARRQQETLYAVAVLREWGQLDLDRGDRASAESKWTQILELSLPRQKPTKPAGATPQPLAPLPAPPSTPPAKSPSPTASRLIHPLLSTMLVAPQAPPRKVAASPVATPAATSRGVPVPTADQFKQAYELSRLAAEKGMTDLSLRAMREAVRGGPPVNEKPNRGGGGAYRQISFNGNQYLVMDGATRMVSVDQALATLVPKWRALKVPPADVYDVLIGAILPESRPAEVFLYGEGRQYSMIYKMINGNWNQTDDFVAEDTGEVRGLGTILAETAVEAGKTDDLHAKLRSRAAQPLGELPAKVLLAQLAQAMKDDARIAETLKTLGERVQTDSVQTTNDRVTSVLVPMLMNEKFAPIVLPYLEKAASNYAIGNNLPKAIEIRFKVAEYHTKRKDEAAAKAQYKAAEALGTKGSPTGYDVHQPLAKEYLKIGWVEDALRELGLHADKAVVANRNPAALARRAEPTLEEFPQLLRLLYALPAEKRYALLKAWSLPTAGRKSIRYYVGTTPKHLPPTVFGSQPLMPANAVVSTILLLAEAAKEAGKLDELLAEADKLATEKVENAELFHVLTYLSAGKGKQIEPAVKAFADSAKTRMTPKTEERIRSRYDYAEDYEVAAPVYPSEFLFTTLCLADPSLAAIGGENLLRPMLEQARKTSNAEFLPRIRSTLDRIGAGRAGNAAALLAGTPSRWNSSHGKDIWFAQDGYAVAAWNQQDAFLLLDTPLAGTFEFSVDVSQGMTANGHVGYAGVVFAPSREGMPSVWPVGRREQIYRATENLHADQFNRMTVQVSPDKVRCLVNGKQFFEDTNPPPLSPWVMLATTAGGRPVFRNFTLTGTPTVPSEVRMSGGDYLDGWVAQYYGGNLPLRLQPREMAQNEDMNQRGNYYGSEDDLPGKKTPVYDWQSKAGEIIGRRIERPGERIMPSVLSYFRPMQAGETIRYEFFHEPGQTHVHPSLGRLAFLLEADGVKLHWLTDKAEGDWTGLKPDHATDTPAGRKVNALTFKNGDWNAVSVTTVDDSLKIDLNGTTIYETKLPAELERQFGFFHFRNKTGVRVKNVVLTGNWPKTVPTSAEIALSPKSTTPAAAKARRGQIGERYYFTESAAVSTKAQSLPAAERYRLLAEWVLPNATRPSFQLAGEMQPRDILGVVDQKDQPTGKRIFLGGRFVAPCLDLVAAAKEAGMLDELADRLQKSESPATDDLFQRSKAALLAIVRAAQGRDADATAALGQLLSSAAKIKPDAEGVERWPSLIAVLGTLDRPALVKKASDLAEALNRNVDAAETQKLAFEDQAWWLRASRMVRAATRVVAQPSEIRRPFGSDPGFANWAAISGFDAASRSQGWMTAHWLYEDGKLIHLPGHSDDYLLFRTPLRGNFEVIGSLRLKGNDEAHIRYGSYQFDLESDRKKYRSHTTMTSDGRSTTITPPLPEVKDPTIYEFKLAVKDGTIRFSVDGREVTSEKIGTSVEPWLMIHSPFSHSGVVQNLKLTGTPSVPDKIDLLAGESLGLWRPYMSENWTKRGEEIYHMGQKPEPPAVGKVAPPRSFPEVAIHYQRPFLEDGVVEYEFFFDPDKALVHPALDRLVFLLEPDGVKLHWLTDGPNEKSSVSFDNESVDPSHRKGPAKIPLKPKAWNAVRLTVKGDTVSVSLNGTDVYERPIPSTNQRTFGLFHYRDRSEARVRSMTYTGDWPKQLPAVDKLFETAKPR